jgi:hypothetical protein
MPPTLEEVKSSALRNLAEIPFYGNILRRPVEDYLGRCGSAEEALRSRIVRNLHLGTRPWTETASSLAAQLSCILHPERAFPRFRTDPETLGPRGAAREFDQAMLDGFAAIDGAIYTIRDEAMESVEMLSQRGSERRPDALARRAEMSFPIEAKRLRGEIGFFYLQDEIDARRAMGMDRLSDLDVYIQVLPGTPRHLLETLSEEELTSIGEAFERMATRTTGNERTAENIDLGTGRFLRMEVSRNPNGGQLLTSGPVVSAPAGEGLDFDTAYLEEKISSRIQAAAPQLAAVRGGVNWPEDLVYLQIELPSRTIFDRDEIQQRLSATAEREAQRLGVRTAVKFV